MSANDLSEFCRLVLAAIEEPEAGGDWFSRHYGLCNNARAYDDENYTDAYDQLKKALNYAEYPFNNDSQYLYIKEKDWTRLYQNERRLAFLREHAAK